MNQSNPDPQVVAEYVLGWLRDERAYQIEKFGLEQDDQHTQEWAVLQTANEFSESWWEKQFENYLGRASVIGLDTPNGRQALAKFVATAVGMLEAAIRLYGPLPEPGVPSGQNPNNLRPIE